MHAVAEFITKAETELVGERVAAIVLFAAAAKKTTGIQLCKQDARAGDDVWGELLSAVTDAELKPSSQRCWKFVGR